MTQTQNKQLPAARARSSHLKVAHKKEIPKFVDRLIYQTIVDMALNISNPFLRTYKCQNCVVFFNEFLFPLKYVDVSSLSKKPQINVLKLAREWNADKRFRYSILITLGKYGGGSKLPVFTTDLLNKICNKFTVLDYLCIIETDEWLSLYTKSN